MIMFYNVTRKMEATWKRFGNQFYRAFNMMKFSVLGVKYGKHCVVHGSVRINLGKNARVTIGDNFCFLSGRTLNPLSRNLQGSVCVNENAELTIGNNVNVSSAVLWCHQSIKIGNHVDIGANTIVMDSDAHSMNYLDRRKRKTDFANKKDRPIVIGNDVLIGMNCIILKGVTIGDRSIIGAGSVVTRSVPSDCIVVGNPAKVVRDMCLSNNNIQNGGVI